MPMIGDCPAVSATAAFPAAEDVMVDEEAQPNAKRAAATICTALFKTMHSGNVFMNVMIAEFS